MRTKSLKTGLLVGSLVFLSLPGSIAATTCAPDDPDYNLSPSVSTIGLSTMNLTTELDSALTDAIQKWNTCPSVADFKKNQSGNLNLTVRFHDRPAKITDPCKSTSTCACADVDTDSNANINSGGVIRIYNTSGCFSSNADRLSLIAHELGHILGLNDTTSSSCGSRIMFHQQNGAINVTADDCTGADTAQPSGSSSGGGALTQPSPCN